MITNKTNDSAAREAGHTPGPWDVMPGKTLLHIETPLGHARPGIAICSVPKKHEANARLIASAPELLEALKDALFHADEVHEPECVAIPAPVECNCYLSRIRAAIAKAEGRQP